MSGRMRAAMLHAPADLRYEEVPIPEIAPGEVLLRIRAVGNCGSDLQRIMVEGTHVFPCIPGHEFAGEIAAAGPDVQGYSVGDRVTAAPLLPCMRCEWCLQGQYNMCEQYDYVGSRSHGAFAEYMKIPAGNLVKLPDSLGYEEASMTDPACVALHAVLRAGGIRPGQTAVVLGSGPIGMFAVQWLSLMGAGTVIATDIVDDKLKTAEELGAGVTIHALREDVVERILSETDGKGADLLIETAGSLETHKQALLAARKRGRIVHVGRAYRDMLIPDEVFTKIFRKELTVVGAVNSNFSPYDHEWKTVVACLGSGKLKGSPLVSHRLPLEEAAETFRKMFDREMSYNKIIFFP